MKKILFLLSISLLPALTQAQESYPVAKGRILFDGYDPVSYFEDKEVRGDERYTHEVDGRRILFASQEHLERFRLDPEKHMPAYGGWCAIAMTNKTFVVPDYGLYKIQDGRLMFFAIRAFFNGLTEWEKNPEKNQIKADLNYVMLFPER